MKMKSTTKARHTQDIVLSELATDIEKNIQLSSYEQYEINNKNKNKLGNIELYPTKEYSELEYKAIQNYGKVFWYSDTDTKNKSTISITSQLKPLQNKIKKTKQLFRRGKKAIKDLEKMQSKSFDNERDALIYSINSQVVKLQNVLVDLNIQLQEKIIEAKTFDYTIDKQLRIEGLHLDYIPLAKEILSRKNISKSVMLTTIDELETGMYLADIASDHITKQFTTRLEHAINKIFFEQECQKAGQTLYYSMMWWDFSKLTNWLVSPEAKPNDYVNNLYFNDSLEIARITSNIQALKNKYTNSHNTKRRDFASDEAGKLKKFLTLSESEYNYTKAIA